MVEDTAKTILIVDDEPDIRDVLSLSLQDMGYRTQEAENARQAFDLFQGDHPPIVITDIKMPGGDGIQLLRKIKHENPETEVIMITGHGDMDLAIRSLKYQATDFITKPINVDVLEIALRRALDKIAMRQKLQDYTRNLEQLVKEKTQLQDHLASLGLMIGSVSHGMKGLLTNLDGGLYLVSSGLDKNDLTRIAEGCAAATKTVGRIRRMVLDILYTAKERKLNRSPVQAVDLAEELVRIVQPRIDECEIVLKTSFDKTTGAIDVDVEYLQTALLNILDNAVDACSKDHGKTAHRIAFGVHQDKGEVIFRIADNGIGMDRDVRDHIFDLFYSTKGRKGTGLGLFIANRVIGQHGGAIQVASEPGKGSAFEVRIPKTPTQDGPNGRNATNQPAGARKLPSTV
jgi:signal transduction histidine kinase